MKPSASKVDSCPEQEELLDALELTHRVQGQRDVGEESVEVGSGEASMQPTRANSGLEAFSFRDFETGTIQGNSGTAVHQPSQAGLGLESQEQPNVEEEEVDIIAEILQAITRRMNNLRNDRNNLRNDRHMNTSNILDKEEVDIIEEILQGFLRKDWLMNGRHINGLRSGQVGSSHREEENIVPYLGDGQGETSLHEEAGVSNSILLQEPPLDRGNLRNDVWSGPPTQGTAWHRKRLQVPLCDWTLLSEPKCASTASKQETELEGSIACVTESDHSNVAQHASQDVSGSSSNSPVRVLLGFLRDACILVHLASGVCRKPCIECTSGLAPCLFWIATLILIFICLIRSFC